MASHCPSAALYVSPSTWRCSRRSAANGGVKRFLTTSANDRTETGKAARPNSVDLASCRFPSILYRPVARGPDPKACRECRFGRSAEWSAFDGAPDAGGPSELKIGLLRGLLD